jgi:hypothetical protein
MYEATARSGSNASSVGVLALAMLYAQQVKLAYETVTVRAEFNLPSTRHETIVRET